MGEMDAKLIVVGGKASKGSVALKLPTVIGRNRKAGLTIAHPMISRRHCELFEADGLLMVRDLGSLNGTVIDGRRVQQAPLPPEGEFTIGPITFRAQYEYAGDLNALPEAVLAEPVASQPEREEAWTDSPQPVPVGEAVYFDPMTEAPPPVDAAEVEVAYRGDPASDRPVVAENEPAAEASPPAASAKAAAPKQKAPCPPSTKKGRSKKKPGRGTKPESKAPANPPPPAPPEKKQPEDAKAPSSPEPAGDLAPPKELSVKPGEDDFDIDAFLDGLK